jgi:hypothetical protein
MPTTPVLALPYPGLGDPADVPTDMGELATALDGLIHRVTYSTTPPGTPVSGDEWILVPSTTNPSYQWRLRYNSASTSPYKWEFVGGSPLAGRYNANQAAASPGVWGGLNPIISIPRAGEYLVSVYLKGTVTAASQLQASFTQGASPADWWGAVQASVGDSGMSGVNVFQTLTAGNLSAMGWTNTTGTTWKMAVLSVIPARIS